MALEGELGQSIDMIAKAEARIRTQKRLISIASFGADERVLELGKETLALMEERLALLLKESRLVKTI